MVPDELILYTVIYKGEYVQNRKSEKEITAFFTLGRHVDLDLLLLSMCMSSDKNMHVQVLHHHNVKLLPGKSNSHS